MRGPEAPDQYHVSSISLRLRHPDADVGGLLRKWGFPVGRAWVAGNQRVTRKGQPFEGVWSESYAYADIDFPEGMRLAVSLERALDRIEEAGPAIAEFVDAGGYAELFVGWIFEGNSGDELGWELLARLASMGLALSFDIYPPTSGEV